MLVAFLKPIHVFNVYEINRADEPEILRSTAFYNF